MSEKKIIYGFHSITSRIRLDVNSVKEIYLDESRNDARMNDLLKLIKLHNINFHLSSKNRLDGMIPTQNIKVSLQISLRINKNILQLKISLKRG